MPAWITLLLALVLLYLCAILPCIGTRKTLAPFAGHFYAHRGYHDNKTDAPENSMPAFALAVQNGYGIELDIQLSKDGQVVVFHDDTLARACGVQGKVSEYTYAELSEFSLFGSEVKIPLFCDVLALVDGQTPLIVEFKTTTPNTPLCKAGSELLQAYSGQYCIESFHPSVVQWYKKNLPAVVRGQLACPLKQKGWQYKTMEYLLTNALTRPHFIAYDYTAKNNISRRLCHTLFQNCAVAWTIPSQAALDACKGDFDLYIFEGFAPQR